MAVPPVVLDYIKARALASDEEICGALIGRDGEISAAVDVVNQSSDRISHFFIPANEVLRIEREAERRGNQLLGFFHSHPSGSAAPSAYDLEQAVPGYVYLIVARAGVARAWRLRGDRSGFDEVTVAP